MSRTSSGPRLIKFAPSRNHAKKWYIAWQEGGRQKRRGTGVAASEPAPTSLLTSFIDGHLSATRPGPALPHEITIAEVLKRYARDHAPTVEWPERIYEGVKLLAPYWADHPVSAINGDTCRAYLDYRQRQGRRRGDRSKPIARSTLRKELDCLSAALKFCADEAIVVNAPKVWRPEKGASRDAWLDRDEVGRLIRAARHDPRARRYLPLFIQIGVYTGRRKNAILALRWTENTEGGWVDLEKEQIHFNPIGREETKKKRGSCGIHPRLLRFLKIAYANRTSDYVFARKDGTRIEHVDNSFRTAVKRSGVGPFTIHGLRHTAASWLGQSDAPIVQSCAHLGMSPQVFTKVYAKADIRKTNLVFAAFG